MAVISTATSSRRRKLLLLLVVTTMLSNVVDNNVIRLDSVACGRLPPLVALLEAGLPQPLRPVRELDPWVLLHERAVRLQRRKLMLHSHRRHAVPHFLHTHARMQSTCIY
jgi:hypothetical protein